MNRRHFINSIGISGTAVALAGIPETLVAAPEKKGNSADENPLFKGTPAMFAPAPDGVTITQALNAAALVRVQYGEEATTAGKLNQVAGSDAFGFVPHDENVVKIRIQNLKPGTKYLWRVAAKPLKGGEEVFSKIYSFKTLDPGADTVRFSVWNDTHDHAETIKRLHEKAKAAGDDFLLWNGDVSNNVNDPAILPGLYVAPEGVDLADGPPIFMTCGNHDTRGLWANKMTDYVDFPGGRPFYAMRLGPLALIMLDTGEDKPDSHSSFRGTAAFEPLIREQAAWLEEVIKRPEMRDAPYRVAACHIPLRWKVEKQPDYGDGGYDWVSLRGRAAWGDALKRWGVQLIISGHTHEAAHLPATAEFPYWQIVGGGPMTGSATTIYVSADAKELRVVTERLHGMKMFETRVKPIGK